MSLVKPIKKPPPFPPGWPLADSKTHSLARCMNRRPSRPHHGGARQRHTPAPGDGLRRPLHRALVEGARARPRHATAPRWIVVARAARLGVVFRLVAYWVHYAQTCMRDDSTEYATRKPSREMIVERLFYTLYTHTRPLFCFLVGLFDAPSKWWWSS